MFIYYIDYLRLITTPRHAFSCYFRARYAQAEGRRGYVTRGH